MKCGLAWRVAVVAIQTCTDLVLPSRYAVRGDALRPGADTFCNPAALVQRRYEALRAYLVDGLPAAEVADRFGYSTAGVHQMATLLRTGKTGTPLLIS